MIAAWVSRQPKLRYQDITDDKRVGGGHRGSFGWRRHPAVDAAQQNHRHHQRRHRLPGDARPLAQRDRLFDRKVVLVRHVAVHAHLRERHQKSRDHAAHEQVADRRVRDQRVDHHRNGRRNDRPDHRRCGGDRRRIADRIAIVLRHHVDADLAGAGEIGNRGAGHAREDDALHDIDVAEAALEAADQHVAERQQVIGHLAEVHQLGGEQEQRHGEQHVAVHETVQNLLRRRSDIEPREQQVENRSSDHRIADRQSEKAQPDDGVDADREWAEKIHITCPEPIWISGARPRRPL